MTTPAPKLTKDTEPPPLPWSQRIRPRLPAAGWLPLLVTATAIVIIVLSVSGTAKSATMTITTPPAPTVTATATVTVTAPTQPPAWGAGSLTSIVCNKDGRCDLADTIAATKLADDHLTVVTTIPVNVTVDPRDNPFLYLCGAAYNWAAAAGFAFDSLSVVNEAGYTIAYRMDAAHPCALPE